MELRPLKPSDAELLEALQQQDDVWEFVGQLPEGQGDRSRLFAIVEGPLALGVGGLVKSHALEGKDLEVLWVVRPGAQRRGLAKRACELILDWAFDTAKVDRVIASIDDHNEGARSIATKIGM